MNDATHRTAILLTHLAVAVVMLFVAFSAPASAHAGGAHATTPVVSSGEAQADTQAVDTCCHTAGTCSVQFLQTRPGVPGPNMAPYALAACFVAVRAASLPSATDPPPPRP